MNRLVGAIRRTFRCRDQNLLFVEFQELLRALRAQKRKRGMQEWSEYGEKSVDDGQLGFLAWLSDLRTIFQKFQHLRSSKYDPLRLSPSIAKSPSPNPNPILNQFPLFAKRLTV